MSKIEEASLKLPGTHLWFAVFVCFALPFLCSSVFAETTDFGGHADRYKGGGDRVPPSCQIDVPRSASEPFFIKWSCQDRISPPEHIRTELWLLRRGAAAPVKVADFLGFPAAVQIDAGLLQAESVSEGLPIAVRLLARDRAGITAISPFITVSSQDNSLDTCDLRLTTASSRSTGGTTGVPSLYVLLDDAMVTTEQLGNNDAKIYTPVSVVADPCEISEICGGKNEVSFDSVVVVSANGAASGTISIQPGNVMTTATGSAELADSVVQSLEVSGTTVIDGVVTEVTLSCQR